MEKEKTPKIKNDKRTIKRIDEITRRIQQYPPKGPQYMQSEECEWKSAQ